MKIILRNARKNAWSNIGRFKACFLTLASYYMRSGALYTGLTEEEARTMEIKLGYQEGTLSRMSKFWETYAIRFNGEEDRIIDTDIPEEELQYLFLREHKRVQNGLANLKPGAEIIMINMESEAEEKNRINKVKRDALVALSKLGPKEMRQSLRIFGFNSDDMSDEIAENTLFDFVERNPGKFLERWVKNNNKLVEFLIDQAVSKQVIKKNRTTYKYGSEIIGHNREDAIDYLLNPQYQDIRVAIEQETEAKYRAIV